MANKARDRAPDRAIAFSDAIFAFAITLLAFSIKVPDVPPNMGSMQLVAWLATLVPAILIYALSFWVIANFWLAHHHMFEHVRRLDDKLIWLNLAFLFVVSLLPFPTAVLVDYGDASPAPMLYAASMALSGLLLLRIWLHAAKNRHLEENISQQDIRRQTMHSLATSSIFLISIPVALFSPFLAELSWLLIFAAKPVARMLAAKGK